jgi:hypothetical protein
MRTDSEFLTGLIGKSVRITLADEQCLPPLPELTLQEISALGVVATDKTTTHFFPWNEIVEIRPERKAPAQAEIAELESLLADSEI